MEGYACIAAIDDGRTRCRNAALPGSKFCGQHKERATIAPPPDIIMIKPKVNPGWFGLLADTIRLLPGERRASNILRHIEQAEALGRDAFALRKGIEDSGSPVFRGIAGQCISIADLFQELTEAGYVLTDIHAKPAKNQPMLVLTIVLSRGIDPAKLDPDLLKLSKSEIAKAVMGIILSSVWKYVHVWANPPDREGRIPHTVNLAHRHPAGTPAKNLRFSNGLWELTD